MARLRGHRAGSTWQFLLLLIVIIVVLLVLLYQEQISNLFQGATTLQLVEQMIYPVAKG